MRQEHPSAAIAVEAQFVQNLANVYTFFGLTVLVSLADHEAELLPFVGDYLAAAEASNWDYHLLIML
jgi:hypothetical protein